MDFLLIFIWWVTIGRARSASLVTAAWLACTPVSANLQKPSQQAKCSFFAGNHEWNSAWQQLLGTRFSTHPSSHYSLHHGLWMRHSILINIPDLTCFVALRPIAAPYVPQHHAPTAPWPAMRCARVSCPIIFHDNSAQSADVCSELHGNFFKE